MSCCYAGCLKTSPLTRGMCSEHYAITAERERYITRGFKPKPNVVAASKERAQPYALTGTRLGRRALAGEPQQFIRDHVGYHGDDCVLWPFARAWNGYPEMQFGGKQARAHRVMCMLAHGDPPEPYFEASHICENGHEGCVNPRHLMWETHYDNHQRRAKGKPRSHLRLVA